MCKCIREWRTDPDAQGAHNMIAYSCEDHIKVLEKTLAALDKEMLRVFGLDARAWLGPQKQASSTADSAQPAERKKLETTFLPCTMCYKIVPIVNGYYASHSPGDDPYVECNRTGDVPLIAQPGTDHFVRLSPNDFTAETLLCPHGSTNLGHCCNENNPSCTSECKEDEGPVGNEHT